MLTVLLFSLPLLVNQDVHGKRDSGSSIGKTTGAEEKGERRIIIIDIQ